MRIALLSYRSKQHVGGQGVYVRRLSAALTAAGHSVHVFSGQPYPQDLADGVEVTPVPSLNLYDEERPFQTPPVTAWRDWTDITELADMWTAGFGEPRTFARRVARLLGPRLADFDVIHDNQCLGYGLLDLLDRGAPLVATIHHPITSDRRLDIDAASSWMQRVTKHRWYGFVDMQRKVAQQLPGIITVSRASAADLALDFGINPQRIHTVPCGVDTNVFHPDAAEVVPGRIVCVASADSPLKGVRHLIEALAQLPEAHLELVSSIRDDSPVAAAIAEHRLHDHVRCHHGLSETELAKCFASAHVVAVPSLYEGFSLPTLEAMASGRPVVASDAGAIGEVLGRDGACGTLVPPGNVDALAGALRDVLTSEDTATARGRAGRVRAIESFTWDAVAEGTLDAYRRILTH